jgi:hypothetical protein
MMGRGYIEDWATKAARRIKDEPRGASEDRIAAIIATFAEPLMKLLHESRREHILCEDGVCYKATVPEDEMEEAECTCGADAWNAKVDKALDGLGLN